MERLAVGFCNRPGRAKPLMSRRTGHEEWDRCKYSLASVLVLSFPAVAADLNGYNGKTSEYGSPYDDPRYADIYRHPRTHERVPRRKYDYDGRPRQKHFQPYSRPLPYRGHYERRPGRSFAGCMSRREVRWHLRLKGWSVKRWVLINRFRATAVARRRYDDRVFDVTIHRCTGRVLAVSPIHHRYEDYAWRRRIYERRY